MFRRAFTRALALSAATAVPGVRTVFARPLPPTDRDPDPRPISPDNPRIWPAVTRSQPLLLGAVDAFRAPDRAAEVGVQWQRIMFDWSAVQRHGPDDWSFGSASPEMARRERIAGRPIVGQFISTPSWASGTSDPKSPPLGLDLGVDEPGNVWAAWIRAVVGRFEGSIDTWVMWNEPDVWSDDNHARQWTGTIEQYYQLLKVGYRAAKSANPNARVLLAGMTYWWDAAYGREQYFERLLRLISADTSARANGWYFDAAVLQLYNNPRGLFDAPRIFNDLMRMHAVDRPVWVNETNVVPWDDPAAPLSRAHFRATLDEQANYLVQAIACALAGGVERVEVYKMMDDDVPLTRNVDQAFGMVRSDTVQSARPVFRAFQMLSREMAPTTRAQMVDEGAINRVYLEQPSLGRRMTVLWNCSPQPRTASIAALGPSAALMDRFGAAQPLQVYPVERSGAWVGDDRQIQVGLAPATANTVTGFPDAYFIGGAPALVLEPLPSDYQPFAPTYANLPSPGLP